MRGWTEEDWRDFYEERAAIREYDGGWPRAVADRLALADVIAAKAEAKRKPG